jgi:hypothetical protein
VPKDSDGNEVREGDTLELCVGIPGRPVLVKVARRKGRLVATNAEGRMSLAACLKWYDCSIIR